MRPATRQHLLRSPWPAPGILLAALLPVLSAATVGGTVVARDGSRLKPVFRAEVIARETGSAEIVAVARTDRDGRFLISGLSSPRVTLAVEKSRYFTAGANGREGENLTLDCTVPADCGNVTFELALGGVVSGMVRDEFGEPVSMAMVTANPPEQALQEGQPSTRGRPRIGRSVHTATDERGYFRLFGLKPGPYLLKSERPARGPMSNMGFEGEPVDIDVEQGREIHGVLITGRRPESARRFTVSGKVTGVNSTGTDTGFVMVQFLGPGSMRGGFSTGSSANQEGSFTFPRITPGRYAFNYIPRANRGTWTPEDFLPLGVIEVQSDLTGLLLRPLPPTGFSGVLKFESANGPPEIQIRASSGETWRPFSAVAKAPDYRFEITNLVPGTYRLEVGWGGRGFIRGRESGDFFLRGIRRGSEITPAREITLPEGKVEQLELVVSNEFSRVYGRVKAAAETATGDALRKGAQFQVGLSGPGGFRAAQADQHGRFNFDRVVPGEYKICAWSDPDAQAIYDEKTWAAAGDAVRKFEVDAGSEVEIDLTAVP